MPPIRSLRAPETPLPFAMHQVRTSFETAVANAIEPDRTAASALLVPV